MDKPQRGGMSMFYVGLVHISPRRGWRVSLIESSYKHGAPELSPTCASHHLLVAPASAQHGGGLPQHELKAQVDTACSVATELSLNKLGALPIQAPMSEWH